MGFLERGNLQKTPRLVALPEEESVTMIASGNNHLVMLGQSGRVYTCGCGESGQLGRLAEMFASRDSRNRNGIGERQQLKTCLPFVMLYNIVTSNTSGNHNF